LLNVWEGKKKRAKRNVKRTFFSILPSWMSSVKFHFLKRPSSPKCCEKEGRRTRMTARRPGVKEQNVFWQPRFGDNNKDFHVPCTPNPAMSLASVKRIRHTGRVTSPKKRVSPEISLRFLCAHASSYDCMPFWSHMSACDMHQ
jgi:hypothetical protein